jgi:hypothetical protein
MATDQQPPSPKSSVLSALLEHAQRFLGLIAYITVLGFIVSTAILLRSTAIMSFAVYPQQYVVLGVLFLFYFTIRIVIPLIIGTALIGFLVAFVYSMWTKKALHLRSIAIISWQAIHELVASRIVFWVFMIALALIAAFQPELVFPMPTTTQPKTVTLILKEAIDPAVWHLQMVAGHPQSTQPVQILMEYTDGLLVRDVSTGIVIKISSDMIEGVVDNTSFPVTATPTSPPPTLTP